MFEGSEEGKEEAGDEAYLDTESHWLYQNLDDGEDFLDVDMVVGG